MPERSKLQRLLNNAPSGVREMLDALNQATGTNYPTEVPIEPPVEGIYQEVKDEEPQQSQDEIQISTGDEMSAPNEQEQALSTAPEKQQAQLNAFSKELSDKFADGASSLVDQDVMGMLQRLPKAGQSKWWKLALSGREGWKALAAEGKEIAAGAKLRNSIADTAITLANLGEEEMEREVFLSFISTLKKSMGEEGIRTFCEEQGIDTPEEDTMAEKILLLRVHSANLGLARYREAIRDQMVIYTKEKAKLEGETALSKMRADMLPSLIQAKKNEYPLQQKRWFQKVGHGSSLFVGTFTSIASGFVVGGLAGIYYGSEEALDNAKKRAGKGLSSAGDWIGEKADSFGEAVKSIPKKIFKKQE